DGVAGAVVGHCGCFPVLLVLSPPPALLPLPALRVRSAPPPLSLPLSSLPLPPPSAPLPSAPPLLPLPLPLLPLPPPLLPLPGFPVVADGGAEEPGTCGTQNSAIRSAPPARAISSCRDRALMALPCGRRCASQAWQSPRALPCAAPDGDAVPDGVAVARDADPAAGGVPGVPGRSAPDRPVACRGAGTP